MLTIEPDDLSSAGARRLLSLHLAQMHADSPPGTVQALDATGLSAADVTTWTAKENGEVVGMLALKALGGAAGELKSMRTCPDRLRRGIGKALLEHAIAEARRRGYRRVSLETGSSPAFEPALALYRRFGFAPGEPFGEYIPSAFNQFLHLPL